MANKKSNAKQIAEMLKAKQEGKTVDQINKPKAEKVKPEKVVKEKKPKVKKQIFKGEIIWCSILSAFWLFGLVTSILGICAFNVGKLATNQLYQLQKGIASFFKMNGVLDFRIVGSIFMLVSTIIYLIVVFVYSNKATEALNKERRKQERMKILMESDEEGVDASNQQTSSAQA